jgi:hypothetical protein
MFLGLQRCQARCQTIERPSAQLSKGTGLAVNAAGVFTHSDIADVVQAVFDQPMIADCKSCLLGTEVAAADIPGSLTARLPLHGGGVEEFGMALDLYETLQA